VAGLRRGEAPVPPSESGNCFESCLREGEEEGEGVIASREDDGRSEDEEEEEEDEEDEKEDEEEDEAATAASSLSFVFFSSIIRFL